MGLEEMDEMLKQVEKGIWKPKPGYTIKGEYLGIVNKTFNSNEVAYYSLKTDDGIYLVPQYGWLKKHWPPEIQKGDLIGIICTHYSDKGPGKRGYVFKLLWGQLIDTEYGQAHWRWL